MVALPQIKKPWWLFPSDPQSLDDVPVVDNETLEELIRSGKARLLSPEEVEARFGVQESNFQQPDFEAFAQKHDFTEMRATVFGNTNKAASAPAANSPQSDVAPNEPESPRDMAEIVAEMRLASARIQDHQHTMFGSAENLTDNPALDKHFKDKFEFAEAGVGANTEMMEKLSQELSSHPDFAATQGDAQKWQAVLDQSDANLSEWEKNTTAKLDKVDMSAPFSSGDSLEYLAAQRSNLKNAKEGIYTSDFDAAMNTLKNSGARTNDNHDFNGPENAHRNEATNTVKTRS